MADQFYVHYTVTLAHAEPQNCVAGPYSEREVLSQRRDIAGYAGIENVFISESRERP